MKDKMLYSTKCKECGSTEPKEIPSDVVKLFRECGVSDDQMPLLYMAHAIHNSWFYGFGKAECGICGEKKVLVWFDGCSPSGMNVISPVSASIDFWPCYDFPSRKVYVCRFCMPGKDKKTTEEFIKKLYGAMMNSNKHVLNFKRKNGDMYP
jgi:hypothetical protein